MVPPAPRTAIFSFVAIVALLFIDLSEAEPAGRPGMIPA